MAKQAVVQSNISLAAGRAGMRRATAPSRSAPDPIFEAVGRCKTAWQTFCKVSDIADAVVYPGRTAEQQANAEEIWQTAWDDWWTELQNLLKTRPSTMAGLVAVVDYLADFYERHEQESIRDPRIEPLFFNAIAASTRAVAQAGGR